MQFHFTCGHTRGGRQLAGFSGSPCPKDLHSLSGDTSGLLRPPNGIRTRLKAGREARHRAGGKLTPSRLCV